VVDCIEAFPAGASAAQVRRADTILGIYIPYELKNAIWLLAGCLICNVISLQKLSDMRAAEEVITKCTSLAVFVIYTGVVFGIVRPAARRCCLTPSNRTPVRRAVVRPHIFE
jgi:hypothetical protein